MRRYRYLRFICTFVLLAGALGCAGLLYYPDHNLYVEEELMEYRPEDIVLPIKGGAEVHAWYFAAPKAKATIVFLHGNGQNRSSHFVNLYWLIREGYNLLAVEYPGYGETDGKPTPENTVESGISALRYIKARSSPLPLIVYGQSLGGAVALRAVSDLKDEVPVALVVADSSFLSYQRVSQSVLSRSWVTWLLQWLPYVVLDDHFAPNDRVKNLAPTRLLVIHGRQDPVIPYAMGEEIFNTASEPKELWTIDSELHGQPFSGTEGLVRRKEFLTKLAKAITPNN